MVHPSTAIPGPGHRPPSAGSLRPVRRGAEPTKRGVARGNTWTFPSEIVLGIKLTPYACWHTMDLPDEVREQFRRYGRAGGRRRAANMSPSERSAIARRAAMTRWIRHRFGAASFAGRGLPGGELVDRGLSDLASGRTTVESLAVSLAAPRLRREGVPVPAPLDNPEVLLFRRLSRTEGDLAHVRYNAYLQQLVSFADACRFARTDEEDPGAA